MAGKFDLEIEQGTTFEQTFIWSDEQGNPIDNTGYKAKAVFRYGHHRGQLAMSLENELGIRLGGIDGSITLLCEDEQTWLLKPGRGVWDLLMESPNGHVSRLLEGTFVVEPGVQH